MTKPDRAATAATARPGEGTAAPRPGRGATTADAAAHRAVLAAEVRRVRAVFSSGDVPAAEADLERALKEAAEQLTGPSALDVLADGFGLTSFERDLLLLAVAASLEPRARAVTLAEALDLLPGAEWTAVQPEGPLRAAVLLRLGEGRLLDAPLDVDERVLHHLQGSSVLDDRLRPYAAALRLPEQPLPPSREYAAQEVAAAWASSAGAVLLYGPVAADRRDVAALVALRHRGTAWLVAAADLPRTPIERDAFVRLWTREAVLARAVAVVELPEAAGPDAAAAVEAVLRRAGGPVLVSAAERRPLDGVDAAVAVERPSRAEQVELWWRRLPGPAARSQAERLAADFDLGHRDILDADLGPARLDVTGIDVAAPADGGPSAAAARRSSASSTRWRLQDLAERIEPRATWDDLVLPPDALNALRRLADAAAGRSLLLAEGFAAVTGRGLGVTALFSGPSGTGKTFAAEVVAGALGLDLHRVDLSSVVSKWIGETEKHLRRVFDAAEQGGTVLLFDEADALFGRRSEVRDSHDRYANLEVAYLLQRMESYRGVAVLTTNMRAALDPAFLRRVRVVVAFPHPDRQQRAALWRKAFPAGVPTSGLDIERLAAADLTGGDIRSAALQAALVALGQGVPVGMEQVREAVAAELGKHGRSLSGLVEW